MQATLDAAWLDAAVAAGRVTVHAGDVMLPGLGLAHDNYWRLAREADAMIHNGALVNHALSYRDLFEPNVAGTVEVMRFAVAHRRIPIHFISSIGILDRATDGIASEDESAEVLWPIRPIGGPDDYATGYVTSKWAAEVLLGQLHARHGVPTSIFRCGVLLPHQRLAGNVNKRDALHRLLGAIVATRLAPESFYLPSHVVPYFGGIPVDVAARAIVTIVCAGAPGLARYHLDEAERAGTSLDTIVSAIETVGIELERLPYANWYARFVAALEALPDPARASSPLQIVRRWQRPIDPAARRRFDNARLRARLGITGDELAPLSPAYVAAWIEALRV
jgi:fatty acid CoA ligase FadD9